MPQLILHHHDPSPFAEKIRLVFGLKKLSWSSVQVPMIMPKPDLTLLTGGYRKAPVLQIGADVYCDTSLIARELELRFPEPSLFPAGHPGLSYALARWSDKAFFEPGAGLSMGENEGIPQEILDDRFKFFNFMDFGDMSSQMPHCYAQFQAQAQLLEDELNSLTTPYLGGDQPSWIDIQAFFSVWMANTNIPRAAELLEPFPAINRWSKHMDAVGRGERSDTDAGAAHDIAKAASPDPAAGVAANPFHDFKTGDFVTVVPDDYGFDPVAGRLTALDTRRITIERETADLGTNAVHFPRSGYRVEAA
ncbi:MAG: glutathione S-transferase family protein [Pseudomonadota bacterium]